VKVLVAANGTPVDHPYEVNLWEAPEGQPQSVKAPLDPAQCGIDPLAYL
jgi:hypothetical protein